MPERVLLNIPGWLKLTIIADAAVACGHQWLAFDDTPAGAALARVLSNEPAERTEDGRLRVAHTAEVDWRLRALVDVCATIRFAAPSLVQLTLNLGKKRL